MKPKDVLTLGILFLNIRVQAGQIPVVDGILGGISTSGSSDRLSTSRIFVANGDAAASIQRTPNHLRGMIENSGICETTKGVYQASGYADINDNGSIWFWFFAARNNPDSAPLTLWFNGGPGSSSMLGLTQEHGPCRLNNDSHTMSLNPNSWNERTNILYIDQPVGVGFSSGNKTVGTSLEAAKDMWKFMQIWLSDSRFSRYQNRDLAIWTESYGGHYGPAFASYFLSQNSAIASGKASGLPLNLKTLGIGNGLTAPLLQYQGIINYAANNTYRKFQQDAISAANTSWTAPDGCRNQIIACNNNGTDVVCSKAQADCNRDVVEPLARNINPYYTPDPITDPYPPDPEAYLNSISSSVGAEVNWTVVNDAVYTNFAMTGDWMRDSSPDLEKVIGAGVRTLIYVGDADFIVNYQGVELMASVDALNTSFSDEYRRQEFQAFTVSGQVAGLYKNAGNFSYLRIFGAGHQVPAYTFGSLGVGEAALQMYNQIMANQPISGDGSDGSKGDSNANASPTLRWDALSAITVIFTLTITLNL